MIPVRNATHQLVTDVKGAAHKAAAATRHALHRADAAAASMTRMRDPSVRVRTLSVHRDDAAARSLPEWQISSRPGAPIVRPSVARERPPSGDHRRMAHTVPPSGQLT